ncbi:tyrosine-type recombinase/integrase [Brevibacillus sp. 179-C9.3 HS]|uniref:tyrosine-type recombinase/integrase n=1 Tax=unclassified Brevibacillus TaxID=2684853 RepID=UPI0039A2116B
MKNLFFQSFYFQYWNEYANLRPNTKRNYKIYLKRFQEFLLLKEFEGQLDFDKFHASRAHPDRYLPIQESFIENFVQFLHNEKKATPCSVSATVKALKNFFDFLYDMELIEHHPMQSYRYSTYKSPIKNTALSKEECLELLEAAIKEDPFYRQWFVLIWFMLITGLRISEVRFLRRSSVNLDTRMVRVKDGQKTERRVATISESLAIELKRYVNHPSYVTWSNQGDEFLFNHEGKVFSYDKIRSMLKELSAKAGLSRNLTPHDLRRTTGYLMQAGGMGIIEIQHQLGHKILSTTLRYVPPLVDLAKILEEGS